MFKELKKLPILLSIIILASCNENHKKNDVTIEESPVETRTPSEPAENNETRTIPFGGVWVNKKYVDKLMSTKSPKKSQDVVPITLMLFPTQLNKEVEVVMGFHEGTTAKITGGNGEYKIKFQEEPAQTIDFKNGSIRTKNNEFIKLKSFGSKNDYKIVEQLLFAGKYDLNGKEVEFTPSGKIIGLAPFSNYSVLIDYYDAGMQVDQLRLGKSAAESELYGFAFKKNQLIIYELKCLEPEGQYCNVVKNGKKIYLLTRK
ncbi:hypothetical protein EI546_04840 [Aequorivita sp. H23M31]|uniref:Lipoprotein n=1 Tax=Aequorivita ciconiae TaxID=2494375 RepID=A0A410G1E1_9FLAO|nr:hypothetical protein [Aequorivita sp. H23M31]QAA81094.1 hypothetical protein EI546_04840 [Aequorivita sp. H23M31]